MKYILSFIILTLSLSQAWALEITPYTEKAVSKDISQGKPYVLHFYAEWCMICQQQKFMINELKKDDRFNKLTVYVADFDFEKVLKEKYKVERQSTLIVIRDGVEATRSLGIKEKDKIADVFKEGI